MSRGQIRMCGRPRVGVFFFPLKTGGFGPMATGQSNRPVTRYLMPRCAPSAVPGERNGRTSAKSDAFEELFSQVVDADDVEHRSLAPRRSGRLPPTFTLAGPCIGSRGALLASSMQLKNACLPACLPLARPAIFRSPGPSLLRTLGMSRKRRRCIFLSQVLRPRSSFMTLLARHGRTIVPPHLTSLKAAMP